MSTNPHSSPDLSTEPTETLIDKALDEANLNVVRLALFQQTGDSELLNMKTVMQEAWGGALLNSVLAPEHHSAVREKAKAYLLKRASPRNAEAAPQEMNAGSGRRLIEAFGLQLLEDVQFDRALEELAFTEFHRHAEWQTQVPEAVKAGYRVVIIGAGISGIAAAIQLERAGIPYILLERQAGIGGTWRLNTYPSVRVDTPVQLYQFRFEQNYPWAKYFPSQLEIVEYLEHICSKYNVKDKMRFGVEVAAAEWSEGSSTWKLTLRNEGGNQELLEANFVLSASGLFSTPKIPDIPGLDTFEGAIFHTAQWDHDTDCSGRDVAIIGTGSTGVQLMPDLAEVAASVSVFQRTPSWLIKHEKYGKPIPPELRWLYANLPNYWNWDCYAAFAEQQQLQRIQAVDPEWQNQGGMINQVNDTLRKAWTQYIEHELEGHPDLIAKCIPQHAPLVRRPVVDPGWYQAIKRDNVELVTDSIERITTDGIMTADGKKRTFDVIVLGSGFAVSQYFFPIDYVGRNRITLSQLWKKDGARAYLGMAMPGFPNFFSFYGPNGQPRAGGFYSLAEITARYTVSSIMRVIERRAKSIEVRREVFDDYNARLDERTKTLVWELDKTSYYVNEHGRSGVNMPWLTHEYHNMVSKANMDDYILT